MASNSQNKKINREYDKAIFLHEISNGQNNLSDYIKKELKYYDYSGALSALRRFGLCKLQKGEKVVTAKGKRFLEQHQDYVLLYELASPYIELDELYAVKKRNPDLSFENAVIKLLLEKAVKAEEEHDYVRAKALYYDLANMAFRAERPELAIRYCVYLVLMEISGIRYGYELQAGYIQNGCDKQPFRGINVPVRAVKMIRENRELCTDYVIETTMSELPNEYCLLPEEVAKKAISEICSDSFSVLAWEAKCKQAYSEYQQKDDNTSSLKKRRRKRAGNKHFTGTKLIICLLVLALLAAIADLALWQRDNVSAYLTGRFSSQEHLEERLDSIHQENEAILAEQGIPTGQVSREQIQDLLNGDVDAESVIHIFTVKETKGSPKAGVRERNRAEELLTQCAMELYAHEVNLYGQLGAMKKEASAKWKSIPKKERTKSMKRDIAMEYLGQCFDLEKQSDDEVSATLDRYRLEVKNAGGDPSRVDLLWQVYCSEKASAKAYYINLYTKEEEKWQ